MSERVWVVELELKRIQTYLFSVPRLKVMIGANAIMGETLRGRWNSNSFRRNANEEPETLPALAESCGSIPLPDKLDLSWAAPGSDVLYDDNHIWQDDVASVATTTGILSRDAGHFSALFKTDKAATHFIGRAHDLIGRKLPGVLVAARYLDITNKGGIWKQEHESRMESGAAAAVFDVPQAEVCQYSGREPASDKVDEEGPGANAAWVSRSVMDRRARAKQFDDGHTFDVLGFLRRPLLGKCDLDSESDSFPNEFRQLSTDGYLAVVHADGNSVGRRLSEHISRWKQANPSLKDDLFAEWAAREQYFFRNRCLLRKALLEAAGKTFGTSAEGARQRRRSAQSAPFRPLMLGGDDLLVVCGAAYALPFVVWLAAALRDKQTEADELTIGVGVAIVPDHFPFHRAHQLAEQLVQSAKRLKASSSAKGDGNVIDWMVTSESWHGDIADTRYRTAIIDGNVVLTSKPCRILRSQPLGSSPSKKSLEELLDDAGKLSKTDRKQGLARSPLHRLVESLQDGQLTARFVAQTLPTDVRRKLTERHYLFPNDGPWLKVSDGDQSWYVTQLMDLFELYELEMMRRDRDQTNRVETSRRQGGRA